MHHQNLFFTHLPLRASVAIDPARKNTEESHDNRLESPCEGSMYACTHISILVCTVQTQQTPTVAHLTSPELNAMCNWLHLSCRWGWTHDTHLHACNTPFLCLDTPITTYVWGNDLLKPFQQLQNKRTILSASSSHILCSDFLLVMLPFVNIAV